MKLSIKSKLLISILGSCAVVYFATVLYIGINNKNMALNDAKKLIDVNVSENALKIEKLLNYEMAIVKTMAYAFNEYDDTSFQFRNKIYNKMYKGIFDNNPQFYAIWDSWEMSYTDTGWTLPYGRYVNQHIRHEGKITRETITKSMDGDNADYKRIKDGGDADWFEEPYIDNILMTSLITPLYKKGEFIGVIGVDISLERFQQITKAIAPFDSSYAFLLSNKGIYVSTRDTSYIGKPIHEVTPGFDADSNLISNIKSGKYFSYEIKNLNNMGEYYVSFAPIYVGEIEKPWSLAVTAPTKILMIKANQKLFVTITIGIIGLIVITLITWLIAQNITVPLVKATNALKEIATGNIDKG
ncbi:MAG: hypothetical protein HY738_05930, partial [Bacteroidia bacterium]|nr:hypothetical protein [Bacteroidia bacterium]